MQVEVIDHSFELMDPILLLLENVLKLANLLPGLLAGRFEDLHVVAEALSLHLPVVVLVEQVVEVSLTH